MLFCAKPAILYARQLLLLVLLAMCIGRGWAQSPVNDQCTGATEIVIPNSGFEVGTFTSGETNISAATLEPAEAFAPAIFVAGLDKKSVWYKFRLPTIRAVRVTLTQPGTTITAGDVGFAVYQTSSCLPANNQISTKLTPIVTFGNTYHPCVPAGEYLVQVSAKTAANGPIIVQLEVSDQTGAPYDHPDEAYSFGVANNFARYVDFDTECQSIEDSTEICPALFNYRNYHKSAWFTFTTPAYFDHLTVMLSGTGSPSYFTGSSSNALKTFGYTLYKGNATNTAIDLLEPVDACDSLGTNGYTNAIRPYKCDQLDRNTTYSIQLFFEKSFSDVLRLGLITGGTKATAAPLPVVSMPASNKLGVVSASPTGTLNTLTDTWGCNSRHEVTACSPAIRDSGFRFNNATYNLSSFATFTLTHAAAINFRVITPQCGVNGIVRLYKQDLTNNCADLDTANLVATVPYNTLVECLEPGNYVVQAMGQERTTTSTIYYSYSLYNSEQCYFTNLGAIFRLEMNVYTRKGANQYSLNKPGAFDSINRVGNVQQPLANGVVYQASRDTVGCTSTVRPADTTCSPLNDKVIYRQFIVADSGTVAFSAMIYSNNPPFRYKLYKGDANALAAAQNVFAYPDRITGLTAQTLCFDGYSYCDNKSACVVPGTYTFASFGSVGDVGKVDRPSFEFNKTRTLHNSPLTAQDMGSVMDTLGANGGSKKSDVDYWSCTDNAVPINGYQPCVIGGRPATKAIYRQFYLKADALVRIANTSYSGCPEFAYGTKTLFYGKATDGLSGLSPVGNQWNCFASAQTANGCTLLPAGWYTVVSYGTGPSYDSATRLVNIGGRYNSHVGYKDEFTLTITPACPGPKFNRPYKASIHSGSGLPHLLTWGNRVGSTAAYPRTDTTYTLPTESFNCTVDTPFISHPIKSCEPAANRVAYYVFRTTQVSFLQINTGGYFAALYDKDVRTDSLQFATATPIQRCNSTAGFIQFCFFQPGTYTLVVFAKDANSCSSVSPRIFIDQVGNSRFDFAANAYDFGVVPPDKTYHFGKVGDVNPINSNRKPSTDFFYCTTGAYTTDPANPVCNTKVNPNVYDNGPNKPLYDSAFPPSNGVARRNLWYTFVAADPGYVRIKVENKTSGRSLQPRFAVYQSNVDGTLPFTEVQTSGQVDSTVAQGLNFITMNYITSYYCYNAPNNISFYRDPCTATTTRYYVLVENVNGYPTEVGGQFPNTQVEVSVQIDSVNLVLPKFNHYYQASNIGTVGVGSYTGQTDNYSCATRNTKDPVYNNYNNCSKTLWYKFTSTITGNVRYRIRVNNAISYGYGDIQILKETIPGDSTTNGLKIQTYSAVSSPTGTWAQTCVSVGTYYLLLPGCDRINQYVHPEIELIEAVGDYCGRAVTAAINGPGAASASVLVNCHTIGSDYGEFGPQLSCPQDASTALYKSSWFRLDIGGTDTLDVTTYLVENTNAASSDIKYRLMTGDCGAMQEQSCVLDALTQNTYQCLVPGQSYYVQVFTPLTKSNAAVTGTIELKISAIAHADTCAPLNNCLATANFVTNFDCNKDDSVKFVNFSTYGTSISYQWDFGYNGRRSTAVSPSFFYPALPNDVTYQVKLVVTNNSCGQKDSVTRSVLVPGRPWVNLGDDILQCNSTLPIVLKATGYPSATYLWQNNSTADSFRITGTGNRTFSVRVSYNGCSSRDTIRVLISPVASRPLQQIVLCTDSVSVSVRRGFGETYQWSTGATTQSIFMSEPGFYWADITYFDCTYRDSFQVNNVQAAKPLGADTTVCLSGGYLLRATMPGAVSYSWQNGRTGDSLLVTAAGRYIVTINFGNCTIRDTIEITGYPAPATEVLDTSICFGQSLLLPWGTLVSTAGTYRDTLRYAGGCDSLRRTIHLTVRPKPNIGKDTTICFSNGAYTVDAYTPGAVGYRWQDGDTSRRYSINTPGLYFVAVDYGNCSVLDSFVVSGFPAPIIITIDTSICFGKAFKLPWGTSVQLPGTYRDTSVSLNGCDSLVTIVNLEVASVPTLGRDSSATICSGTSFNLSGIYNTAGMRVNWMAGPDTVVNPATVAAAGSYRLIATNAAGCSDTAVVTLAVNAQPNLGSDTTVTACIGTAVNLTRYYTTTLLQSNWSLRGIPVTNPGNVLLAGNYQLIATNGSGCTDTAIVTLTFEPAPVIGPDTSLTRCAGSSINLDSLYTTSGLITQWSLGGNSLTDVTSVTSAGTYRLIVTNNTGCRDTAYVALVISATPVLAGDTLITRCAGGAVNLTTIYPATGFTSRWTLQGVAVASPESVTAPGIYQLIAGNGSGCNDTAQVTLIINQLQHALTDTSINRCSGQALDLTSLYSTTGFTTAWTVNGAQVTNPAAVTTAGDYQLVFTSADGCADSVTVVLSIQPTPALGRDTSLAICQNEQLNLTTFYQTTGFATTWTYNSNPLPDPGSVRLAGDYRLTATNAAGCTSQALVRVAVNVKPNAGNDTAISICTGKVLPLLTTFPTGNNTSSWTLGGSPVLTPQAVTTPGNYQLVVENSEGCSDTLLLSLLTQPKPSLGNDTSIVTCQGNPVDLTSYYRIPGVTARWSLNGALVTDLTRVTVSGNYQLVVTNAAGCQDTAILSIAAAPAPVLGRDTTVNACAGAVVNLNNIYPNPGNTYTWTRNALPLSDVSAVTAAGVFQLISSNAGGCADTAVVTLVFTDQPVVVVTNPAPVCPAQTVNLTLPEITAGSTAGLVFSYWQNEAATIPNPSPVAAGAGTWYIKGTTATGCSSTTAVIVMNHLLPMVNAGPDQTICFDGTTTLRAVVANATRPVSYQWQPVQPGGILEPTSAVTAIRPTGSQQYIVTITDGWGCNARISDTVHVTMMPRVPAFAGNDTIASTGVPLQLQASGGARYLWSPATGLNNRTIPNPTATLFTDSIAYVVEVSDVAGCRGYDTVYIKVYDGITYYVPNAFTPNGDGRNDYFNPVGVGILTTELFRVFNRYGEIVFESTQWRKGWDGTWKGKLQPTGNYVWYIKGKGRNGNTIEMRGNVLLLR